MGKLFVRLACAIASATCGILVMYFEGQHQPIPGVGFVFGWVMIAIAFVVWRKPCR